MKKNLVVLLALFAVFLCACTKVIPTSVQAKEKLESLGYTVEIDLVKGEDAKEQNITQLTLLSAYREEDLVLQVYYFVTPEDTDRFYEDHGFNMRRNQEVFEKYKFTIIRGKLSARDDFLSVGNGQ